MLQQAQAEKTVNHTRFDIGIFFGYFYRLFKQALSLLKITGFKGYPGFMVFLPPRAHRIINLSNSTKGSVKGQQGSRESYIQCQPNCY